MSAAHLIAAEAVGDAPSTRSLAALVTSTSYEDLPADVRDAARIRLLDALGCAVAGRESETTQRALRLADRLAAGGPSRCWITGRRGSPQDAAFCNSVLVHSILHEDVGQGGHPGCNVIPAALAVAEAEEATGPEVLAAVALGYEVQMRMASGDLLHRVGDRGLRGTTLPGTFGAAVAAARLMGLSAAQVADAIALCASLCTPGVEEPLLVGSSERCLQVAQNTRSGILAADLARAGFDGAASALEGDCGFYSAYCAADAPPELTAGLGETWTSLSASYIHKPYPTAGWNVGAIHCMETLCRRHELRAGDIERVHVRQPWWHRNTGYVRPGPFTTVEQALVSCKFAMAATAVFGGFDWETVQRALGDPAVDELASRVEVDGVATWGDSLIAAEVSVHLRDGTRLDATSDDMPRDMWAPTWDDVVAKVERLTRRQLSHEAQRVIVTEVRELDQRRGVDVLIGALCDP